MGTASDLYPYSVSHLGSKAANNSINLSLVMKYNILFANHCVEFLSNSSIRFFIEVIKKYFDVFEIGLSLVHLAKIEI